MEFLPLEFIVVRHKPGIERLFKTEESFDKSDVFAAKF